MSIASAIQTRIDSMPKGKVFGYGEIPEYRTASTAVVKAISRMVAEQRLNKLSKGVFYISEQGILGPKSPSDQEIIKSNLYNKGKLRGYITGLALYNKLGLTTQMPRTITIACKSQQIKEYGTITIKEIISQCPIDDNKIKILQYLDALKDIKRIPDSDLNRSLLIMRDYIKALSDREQGQLMALAVKYYPPQVRALIALIVSTLSLKVPDILKLSLNPMTTYRIGIDKSIWPTADKWNIK